MAETAHWWLIVQLIGLIGLPISFVLFQRLPDRGYSFSKPTAILLTGFLFWLALSLHVLPNRPGSIVWCLIALSVVSGLIARRRRHAKPRDVGHDKRPDFAPVRAERHRQLTDGVLAPLARQVAGDEAGAQLRLRVLRTIVYTPGEDGAGRPLATPCSGLAAGSSLPQPLHDAANDASAPTRATSGIQRRRGERAVSKESAIEPAWEVPCIVYLGVKLQGQRRWT